MCIQGCQEIDASSYIKDERTVLIHIELSLIYTSFLSSSHIHWVKSHRLFLLNCCVKSHFDIHLFQFVVVKHSYDKDNFISHWFNNHCKDLFVINSESLFEFFDYSLSFMS